MNAAVDHTDVAAASPPDSDEAWLLAYRETGDRELFARLVHRYERELYNFLRRYLGDAEMAEDAFQAAFLQVHLKCDQFEEGRRFRPWLYAIAVNQAIDAQRRAGRQRMLSLDRTAPRADGREQGGLADLLVSHETDPAAAFRDGENRRRLGGLIEQLPEHLRSALHLVYFQGMSYRDAAGALEVPVGTVKSRVFTAIQKLTEAWQAAEAPQE